MPTTPANTKRAGVIGWPVSHSLSPRLHSYWLKQYGIEGGYEAIAAEPDALKNTLQKIRDENYAGVNLTIPHKETALSLVDSVDEDASEIGAINTIINRNGKLHGLNTDVYGFMANLKAQSKNKKFARALVLGAGGAARAICAGLVKDGIRVTLAGRTLKKADALAACHKNTAAIRWEQIARFMPHVDLLVNTTPLGMKGHSPLILPIDTLAHDATVYDIVYAPPHAPHNMHYYPDPTYTDLLVRAKDARHPVVTGLGMLLYQAQPAFEAWFGVKPEVTPALEAYVLEALK